MTASTVVERDALCRFYRSAFEAAGVSATVSEVSASALVFADARGVESHGAANLERIYVPGLLSGRIDPTAEPRLVVERSAVALLRGESCLGFLAAQAAMEEAIARARRFGIGAVGVFDSTHCGSMAFYTEAAIAAGMLGLAFTNLGGQGILRPSGGAVPMVGTNVLAASAPAERHPPFSLDMSTAVVSTGRLRTAMRREERIPEGWLVDDDGSPVEDPAAYFDGSAHLQFLGGSAETGGYKGYGLALLVDVLCGILVGGRVGPRRERGPNGNDEEGIGHFMVAIDIDGFRSTGDFRRDLDEMLGALLDCPPAAPGCSVAYPGLREAEAEARGTVSLSAELVASLNRAAELLSLPRPFDV